MRIKAIIAGSLLLLVIGSEISCGENSQGDNTAQGEEAADHPNAIDSVIAPEVWDTLSLTARIEYWEYIWLATEIPLRVNTEFTNPVKCPVEVTGRSFLLRDTASFFSADFKDTSGTWYQTLVIKNVQYQPVKEVQLLAVVLNNDPDHPFYDFVLPRYTEVILPGELVIPDYEKLIVYPEGTNFGNCSTIVIVSNVKYGDRGYWSRGDSTGYVRFDRFLRGDAKNTTGCPLVIPKESVDVFCHSTEDRWEISYTVTNTTDKAVVAFQFLCLLCDAYGDPLDFIVGAYTEPILKPGESEEVCWANDQFKDTTMSGQVFTAYKGSVQIMKAAFEDGKVWEVEWEEWEKLKGMDKVMKLMKRAANNENNR